MNAGEEDFMGTERWYGAEMGEWGGGGDGGQVKGVDGRRQRLGEVGNMGGGAVNKDQREAEIYRRNLNGGGGGRWGDEKRSRE